MIGITLPEYNEMTPHELNIAADIYKIQFERNDERLLHQAYANAYWQRVNVLKSFNEMIGKTDDQEKEKMSTDQMYNKMLELNSFFGGIVVEEGG